MCLLDLVPQISFPGALIRSSIDVTSTDFYCTLHVSLAWRKSFILIFFFKKGNITSSWSGQASSEFHISTVGQYLYCWWRYSYFLLWKTLSIQSCVRIMFSNIRYWWKSLIQVFCVIWYTTYWFYRNMILEWSQTLSTLDLPFKAIQKIIESL